jgi:hypothetical protein
MLKFEDEMINKILDFNINRILTYNGSDNSF